jgi:hypothetical protein
MNAADDAVIASKKGAAIVANAKDNNTYDASTNTHKNSGDSTIRAETDCGEMLSAATAASTHKKGTIALLDGGGRGDAVTTTEDDPAVFEERAPSVTWRAERPGAIRVYPGDRAPSPPTEIENDADAAANNNTAASSDQSPIHAESQHHQHLTSQSDHVVVEAYAVEDPEDPPSAVVVDTCFGIERKRLIIIASVSTGAIAIICGCVLGILARNNNSQQQKTCGPLCGHGSSLPDGNRKVFGTTCEEWNFNSINLPLFQNDDEMTCTDIYAAAAHGCGCTGIEIPADGCGMLCSDSSDFLSNPELVVRDINNQELSCKDWQLKSQFDKDSQECVNYNAIGALCGCTTNEVHPDACGGLCPRGEDFFHSTKHSIWNIACGSWDTFARYLPIWYNNDGKQTCEEYYSEVAHGCACPVLSDVESECGTLCQQHRTCNPICQGGISEMPDPDLVVRRERCQDWEMHSRLEVHEVVCPFYNMVGAQCGCNNDPAPDACGPLCGVGASLPDPDKEVYGQTCESWDFMSMYLGPAYGESDNPVIKSCEEHFSGIAYACGCPVAKPPTDGCGTLCGDGLALPHPTKVVNAKTCQDLELSSLFERDKTQCTRYEILATLCGCPSSVVYEEDCFKLEHLQNQTYYFGAGGSIYSASFGDDGYFAQIQSNSDLFVIGWFNGFHNDTLAIYGGGAPCGTHGPRSGSVLIVEDNNVKSPEITYVIEPSICVYQAELKVPKFCEAR